MSDLKATFIQRSLSQYMEEVTAAMRVAAQRAKVGVTNDAIRSLSYQALQHGSTGGGATLSFHEYLRMVDMGAGRGHPLGGLASMRATLQASHHTGFIQVKDKARKPKKIYSRVAYGKLTWLQNQLLYGYTEETIASLKSEFKS
jgi:hypothetical protein